MAKPYSENAETIEISEHISPEKTGDNIEAKRVASYRWDGTDWRRFSTDIIAGIDYNSLDIEYQSDTVEVYNFKLNSVIIRTITITYSDSSKAEISSVVWE